MNCDIKKIYNQILSDKEITKKYKNVEKNEKLRGGWAFHNLEHIKNVSVTVENILSCLGFGEDFICAAKIACLLHDVGAEESKDDHAQRSYEYARKYFSTNGINFKEMELVLEAIKIHSDGFETNNVIALALILADKLDIKKTRISPVGKTIVGNRQYAYINDIKLNIVNKQLEINFLTDEKIDFIELNEFYFTKKVFKAIEAFANKMKLTFKVMLDNKVWNLI